MSIGNALHYVVCSTARISKVGVGRYMGTSSRLLTNSVSLLVSHASCILSLLALVNIYFCRPVIALELVCGEHFAWVFARKALISSSALAQVIFSCHRLLGIGFVEFGEWEKVACGHCTCTLYTIIEEQTCGLVGASLDWMGQMLPLPHWWLC